MKIMSTGGLEIQEAYLIDYYADAPAESSLWTSLNEKTRSVKSTMSHIIQHIKPPIHFPEDWGKYWDDRKYSTILSTSDFEITHINKDFESDLRETPLIMFLADWNHDEIYLASKNAALLITASYWNLDMILVYPMYEIYTLFKAKKYCNQADTQDYMKCPFLTVLITYDNEKHELIEPLHRNEPKCAQTVRLFLREQNPLTKQIS